MHELHIVLCFLCALVLGAEATTEALKDIPKQPTRIAFIFAGAARSFVAPVVHETIRHNLIRSLCPFPSCIADIFIRLSSSDNNHGGFDSLGHFRSPSSESSVSHQDTLVTKGIERLLAQEAEAEHDGGTVDVQYVDIGSAEENQGMVDWARDKYGRKKQKTEGETDEKKQVGKVTENTTPERQLLLHQVYRSFDRRRYVSLL